MILLRDLLAPWFHYSGHEAVDLLTLDSRKAEAGSLFLAVPGHHSDGRRYVEQALSQGAVAALVHTDDPDEHGRVEHERGLEIAFFQLNRQLSAVAAQRYPLTPGKLRLIGVTGTNGKTSVSQLIAQLCSLQQRQSAVMGTLGNGLWGELIDSGNTTADAITLMRQLAEYEHSGAQVCAMEVSSHGLVQGRVEAVPFEVGVFTNLSRDHLDYHGDMDAYGAAKKRIFSFNSLRHGLINLDDASGAAWFAELGDGDCHAALTGFSLEQAPGASIYVKATRFHSQGVNATLVWPGGEAELASPLLGAFNLSNLLAALGALYLLGHDMAQLAGLVPRLIPVAGRMERFITPEGVTLVVDYAHTPDALDQALQALRRHCDGQLWCLFGCGGDRDKGKRPLMARAAEAGADRLMLTSDNARSEDPLQIIHDIRAGLKAPQLAMSEVDRQAAIRLALARGKAGDVILLAGKGHETYQEVAGVRHDYDERAFVSKLAGGEQ